MNAERGTKKYVPEVVGCIVILLFCLFFLFYGLNHYALWDDEALTALSARGVLKTGDTTAFIDHNIVAFRNGSLLYEGYDRSTPPLSSYILAPVMYLLGDDAWVCRLPFALFGLCTYLIILYWLWREAADKSLWLVIVIALIGNVSLFLYFRQCRYYSPTIFFTVLSAYYYLRLNAERSIHHAWLLFLSLTMLLASSSLNYFVFLIVLGVDYVLWERKNKKLSVGLLFFPVVIHAALVALLLSVWNPLKTANAEPLLINSMPDRMRLMWLALRDMNRCEFFPGLFFSLVPIFAFLRQDRWLKRGFLAFFVYLLGICLFSPQHLKGVVFADVRYYTPLIPLSITLSGRLLWVLLRKKRLLVIGFSFLLFWTNLFNEMGMGYAGLRSTPLAYGFELIFPPPESYTPAIKWVKGHVKPRQSVLVIPLWKTYPLMYHAPEALYAWQFSDPPPREYAHVNPIHIRGRIKPDYIIAFGPVVIDLARSHLAQEYRLIDILPYYWQDLYRPELFWRSFRPVKYDKDAGQEVYILKRKDLPLAY
ncbi:MAG: glycosyltransferase family 39 protein [Syntrophales bacterium]|nr:glycosyltransferase family 39 protein [Syntrophales bacterium]